MTSSNSQARAWRWILATSVVAMGILGLIPAVAGAAGPRWSGPLTIAAGGSLNAVSCPSTGQCTAVGTKGREVTFDPITKRVNRAGAVTVAPSLALVSVSCSSVAQCTAVDRDGHEVTFNPLTGAVNRAGVQSPASAVWITSFANISCPSARQCTAFGVVEERNSGEPGGGPGDPLGGEVTFDPRNGSVGTKGVQELDYAFEITAGTCRSTSLCTAVNEEFSWYTFDPRSGNLTHHGSYASGSGSPLDSLACPTRTLCTGVTFSRPAEVSFDPVARGSTERLLGSVSGGRSLDAISCPSGGSAALSASPGGW